MQNSPVHLIANGMRQDASYKLFSTMIDLIFFTIKKTHSLFTLRKTQGLNQPAIHNKTGAL